MQAILAPSTPLHITRQQWLPIGVFSALLIAAGIVLAYLPALAEAPTYAKAFGFLFAVIAAAAGVGFALPRLTQGRTAVRYENEGAIVTIGGTDFMVLSDGTTYTADRQLAAFQFPDIAFRWQVWHFFRTRPALLPVLLIAVTLMGLSWLLAATAMPGTNPYAEHGLWLFPMLSKFFVLLLNCIGAALLLILVLVGFGPSAVGAIAQEVRKQRALPAGESQYLLGSGQDIETMLLPDRYLFQRPSETSEEFADRIVSERAEHGADNYVVIIAPQNDSVVVACPAGTDNETALQVDEARTYFVPDAPTPFDETPAQYYAFIQAAAKPLKRWLNLRPEQKHGQVEKLLVSLARPVVRYAATLLLLCFAVSGFGQSPTPKSERVKTYLGTSRVNIVPEPGISVVYSFELASLRRMGDGQKNLMGLLSDAKVFSDVDDAGKLVSISYGNKQMMPEVEGARPKTASADLGQGSAQPIKTEIDSNSIRGWLEEGGDITDRAVEVASQGVKMFWQSRMWENFAQIIWFFIGFSMMTSRMFLSENRRTQFGHIYGATAGKIGDCAALVSLVLIWVFYAFLIANVFVVAIGGANPFYLLFSMLFNWSTLLVALWLLFVIGLSKTSDALVQNPKVVKPAGNSGGQGGYNNAQIGSGRD